MFDDATTLDLPPDLENLPLEHIEHELTELAAHIYAGTARWLALVAEFDRREGWGSWGCRSCAEWVSWQCGVAPRAAREHVRVARRLVELPLTREAFAAGALSYSKARAITRIAESESEGELLEVARHATAAQLERIVSAARRVTSAEARDAHEREFLAWSWEEDGSLSVRGRLPAEDGALFLRALEASREALWREGRADGEDEGTPEGGSAEPLAAAPQPRVTPAEALVGMADRSLSAGARHRPAPARHQVVVHVDPRTLIDDAEGRSELEDGAPISPETARRLACDASLVTMLDDADGKALDVGRETRRIPPALARALRARDGNCRFPGCERTRVLDAHHIHHWAHGGETSDDNLLLLCRHHHRLVHEGGYSIVKRPDGSIRFLLPSGLPIGLPRHAHGDRRHLTRRRAGPILTGTGERMDLELNVARALAAAGPR